MLRSELVKKITDSHYYLSKKDSEKVINIFFDSIIETLSDGGRVELRNFGIFTVKTLKKSDGYNPRTGQKINIDERQVVSFKPGKKLLKSVV